MDLNNTIMKPSYTAMGSLRTAQEESYFYKGKTGIKETPPPINIRRLLRKIYRVFGDLVFCPTIVSLVLYLAPHTVTSQFIFTEGTSFEGVWYSSTAFADVDGDGDPDILITGRTGRFGDIIKLYINDGSGGFTEKAGTPFARGVEGSITFADVDGDDDPDVLITGHTGSGPCAGGLNFTKLYVNIEGELFIEKVGTSFTGVHGGSAAFADVDGDGDSDVLITGEVNAKRIAELYINDGEGIFSRKVGTPFEGVHRSSIAFADVDGDDDQDVLITGNTNFIISGKIAHLYINDGLGGFTLKRFFEGVDFGSIAFADVNGDDDPDVLITGEDRNGNSIAHLYINDGSGGFTLQAGTPFERVRRSSIAFADVDGDGDPDVLITGDAKGRGRSIAKLYLNNGSGTFTEKTAGMPFDGVESGSVAFADVDGDGDHDVLITGNKGTYRNVCSINSGDPEPIAKLYINNKIPVFASNITISENTTVVLTVTVSDDSEMIHYRISGGADRALFSINETSGELTFKAAPDFETPGNADNDNDYIVEVTASDGENEVSQAITVSVRNVNEAPTVTADKVSASFTAGTSSGTIATITGSDPDAGDALTYSIHSGDDNGDFTINNSGVVTVANTLSTAKTYPLIIRVTDSGGLFAAITITVNVTGATTPPANNPPTVASAIADVTKTAGFDPFTIDLASVFTDADGDALTYTAATGNTAVVTATVQNGDELLIIYAGAGTAAVRVTADDGNGGTAADEFMVTVTTATTPLNNSPTVSSAIADVTKTAGFDPFTIDLAPVFTDADGDALTYTATSNNTAVVIAAVQNNNQLLVTYAGAGTAAVRVTADDGNGGTAADEFMVTVTEETTEGVLGFAEAINLRIFPNPASGHFILKDGAEQVSGATLISTSGKAVRHYSATKNGVYDTSGLDEGIFFVVIEVGGKRKHAGRLVIRR